MAKKKTSTHHPGIDLPCPRCRQVLHLRGAGDDCYSGECGACLIEIEAVKAAKWTSATVEVYKMPISPPVLPPDSYDEIYSLSGADMPEQDFRVYIIWGDKSAIRDELNEQCGDVLTNEAIRGSVTEYAFKTEAELEAFMFGVEEAVGNVDCYSSRIKSVVIAYVRQACAEYFESIEPDDGGV